MPKIDKLERERLNLVGSIQKCESEQFKIDLFIEDLNNRLDYGQITGKTYKKLLNNSLKNRTKEQWLNYYKNYVKYYKNKLVLLEQEIVREKKKEKIKYIVLFIFILMIGLFSIFL